MRILSGGRLKNGEKSKEHALFLNVLTREGREGKEVNITGVGWGEQFVPDADVLRVVTAKVFIEQQMKTGEYRGET